MPKVKFLKKDFEKLEWSGNFKYDGMVRIRVDADGSCFFNAIQLARNEPYIKGKIQKEINVKGDDGNIKKIYKPIDRKEYIKNLRNDLSKQLGEKSIQDKTKTNYQVLGRGGLEELSEEDDTYSLKSMKELLESDRAVGMEFLEYYSNMMGVDIYILDGNKEDIYITGDNEILHKKRPSIVLFYFEGNPGHFDLIGLKNKNKNNFDTYFDPKHEFIEYIRSREKEIISKK